MKFFIYLLFILLFLVIFLFLSALFVRSITFLVISIRKFFAQFTYQRKNEVEKTQE